MIDGWHVNALDITKWADTNRRQAQDTLPHLVRMLLLASIKPSLLHFRAGDNVSISGWDGVLQTDLGNAFVPDGNSFWEFSTEQKIDKKANSDYQKRTNAPPQAIDTKKYAFVFVTSQPWPKRDSFVQKKNSENQWKQVKGLNADDLETWLEQCSAVHRRFARLIGKRPEGALDIEQAWKYWSYATKVPCNVNLILAGRQTQADELVRKLKENPSFLRILGESEEEAFAFVIAVIKDTEFSPRLLVVNEPREWDILVESQQPLILIPKFDSSSFGLAIQQGHWVIQPVSYAQLGGRQADITLGKADPNKQISALIAMGLDEEVAKDVIHSCNGYLGPIRRHSALAPISYQKPNWVTSEDGQQLAAILLGGSWIAGNKNDCEKLSRLAGISYNDFELLLNKWAIASDSPIHRIGNIWQITSRPDAWSLLSLFINSNVLDRFFEVVKDVLLEIDPRFELPPENRWMANAYGKVFKHSTLFRHGLAEMLAMLASYGDKDCTNVGTYSIRDQISLCVRELLPDGISGQLWGSLTKELPLIAEAAPEVFMDAVETNLKSENPSVMELFVEEGDLGGCPHVGLLWALECISWNLDYLPRIVRIFAKLSHLDPGGRYIDRPANTLKEIFQGWFPQTKASLNERLEILDSLISIDSEGGWKLLLCLLPKTGDSSTQIYRPHFRDWAVGWKKGVTQGEYHLHSVEIVKRLLKHVNEEPSRWVDVVKALSKFPRELLNETITQLKGIDPSKLPNAVANKLGNELRELVSRHREFSDAVWALPKEDVNSLDEIHQKFIPSDLVAKYKFLFDSLIPNLTSLELRIDYKQKEELIEKTRLNAIEEIWNVSQAPGIERLATTAGLPWVVGNSISNSTFSNDIEELVLSWLRSENDSLVKTAKAFVNSRCRQIPKWLETIHERYSEMWSDEVWEVFCLGLPFNRTAFHFLEALPEKVKKYYWKNIEFFYLQNEDKEYANWVIEQLLIHERPLAATMAAAQNLHTIARETGLDANLLEKVLEYAAINLADHETIPLVSISYDISTLLKALQTNPDLDEKRLARIEWIYLHVLSDYHMQPIVLTKEVTQNPSFFVHLIRVMFKANPPIEGEFSEIPLESRKQQAENAWHLFELINKLPGQSDSEINTSQLQSWIEKAREECTKQNRRVIGDEYIGKLLLHSPMGTDGVWPHEAVREVLE